MKGIPLLLVVLAFVALYAYRDRVGSHHFAEPTLHLDDRRDLPDFAVTDEQGQTVRLERYRGKVLLVNFWATWCGPCVKEMPSLDRLSHLMAGTDFEVLTVSQDRGGTPVVQSYFSRNKLTALPILTDSSGIAGDLLHIRGLPTSLILDRQGREVTRIEGAVEWDSPSAQAMMRSVIGLP